MESIPLRIPSGDMFLPIHLAVELLAEEVSALAYGQSSVVRLIGKDVDEALHQMEPRLFGVLIRVRPELFGGGVDLCGWGPGT